MQFYTRREAPKYIAEKYNIPVSFSTLQKFATTGGGPDYQLFGNKAVYTDENLDAWVMAKLSAPRRSTSEASV